MPRQKGRGRALLGAGIRTLGRGLARAVSRSDRGAHWTRVGQDWFETLGELKGAAMKLGQIASQYSDLLPPELAQQLARLQESAQPHPWPEMQALLGQYWIREQHALLKSIDPAPMASASIGQVHRGELHDGRTVAIKIQYAGVAEAVEADVANLGRLLKVAGLLPLDRASIDGLLGEVRARMVEEVDYHRERSQIEAFGRLPASTAIRYPVTVPALCEQRVLVTEWIQGTTPGDASQWPQATRDLIGAHLVDWLITQVFELGLLHADPHPGNFRFHEDGSITVLDFGCVKEIQASTQQKMARLVSATLAQDWPRLHVMLGEIGSLSQPSRSMSTEMERIYAAHTAVMRKHLLAEPHFDFQNPDVIPETRTAIREALPQWKAFRPVPELAFVARTLSGSYWLLRNLGVRVDLQTRFRAIAERVPATPNQDPAP